jgi:glycogen debranching enzyme
MIGGFWAMAARRHGDVELAERLLAGIRAANAHGHPEYLVARSGVPAGVSHQAWSAAAEVLALRGLPPPA